MPTLRLRRIDILVACIVSLLLGAPRSPHAQSTSVPAEVGATVLRRLDEGGAARVLIAFRDLDGSAAGGASARASGIAAMQAAVSATLPAKDLTVIHRYRNVAGMAATITRDALDVLAKDPRVRSIQTDEPGGAHLLVSVPALKADLVRTQLGITGEGVKVAVLDSGADAADAELEIVAEKCFTSSACPPNDTSNGDSAQDDHGHGTHVSAVLASSGAAYAPGFAPAAQLVAVKVLDGNGHGFVSDWVAGLDWVRANIATLGVRVINMSIGTDTVYSGTCDAQQTLAAQAVAQLVALDVVVFASTGNQGSATALAAPACLTGVVAVGATYKGDVGREPDVGTYASFFGAGWPACFDSPTGLQTVSCFTNSSARMDLVAPGAPITTWGLDGMLWTFWGTSQASPTAAGIAALMLQADATQSPAVIAARLKASGPLVTDPKNGLQFASLDALAAVELAIPDPTPTTTPLVATVTPTATRTPTPIATVTATPATHDLAVTKVAVRSRVLQGSGPKPVKVTIQNRGDHDEIVLPADLGDGVTTGVVRLDVSAAGVDDDGEDCQPPVVALDTLKNAGLFRRGARKIKSKAKLTLAFLVTYDCTAAAPSDRGDTTPGDYRHVATVFHDVLGAPDAHAADDACPHDALPGGVDPHPNGRIKDKGCGAKRLDRTLGAPILTNVVAKPARR